MADSKIFESLDWRIVFFLIKKVAHRYISMLLLGMNLAPMGIHSWSRCGRYRRLDI